MYYSRKPKKSSFEVNEEIENFVIIIPAAFLQIHQYYKVLESLTWNSLVDRLILEDQERKGNIDIYPKQWSGSDVKKYLKVRKRFKHDMAIKEKVGTFTTYVRSLFWREYQKLVKKELIMPFDKYQKAYKEQEKQK